MFRELLSDGKILSMTRFLSLIMVVAAILIALIGIWRHEDLTQISILCGVFLSTALGAKVGQKIVEVSRE